jgi:CheY-like chemotaxis protein
LPEVIFITGNSDSLNYSRAKEVGFVAFITKPVQVEELKKALEKCVLLKEKGAA